MAKKIDAKRLENITSVISTQIGENTAAISVTIPMSDAIDICFALDRLRKIQEDIEGRFQEI